MAVSSVTAVRNTRQKAASKPGGEQRHGDADEDHQRPAAEGERHVGERPGAWATETFTHTRARGNSRMA